MIALPGLPANGAAAAATSSGTGNGAAKDGDFMAILAGATSDAAAPAGPIADPSAPDQSAMPDAPVLSLDAAIASLLASAGMPVRPMNAVSVESPMQGAASPQSPFAIAQSTTGVADAALGAPDAAIADPAAPAAPAAQIILPGGAAAAGANVAGQTSAPPIASPAPAPAPAMAPTSAVPSQPVVSSEAGASSPAPAAVYNPAAPVPQAPAATPQGAALAQAAAQTIEAPLRAGREAAEEAPRVAAVAGAGAPRSANRTAASGGDAATASPSPAPSQSTASPSPAASQPAASPAAPAAATVVDIAALPDADLAAMDPLSGELAPGAPADPRSSAASSATAAAPQGAAPRWTAHTTAHLAVQMARRAEAGVTNFAIRLDPAELGRIEVRLSIGADQRVRASLTVERPETLADVMRATRDLVDALADAGLSLEDGALSVALDDRSSRRGAPDREASAPSPNAAGAAADPDVAAPPPAAERWSRGRIDLSL